MSLTDRLNAQRDAYARAVGRPAFWAPVPPIPATPVSPWVARARAGRLPVKEYAR